MVTPYLPGFVDCPAIPESKCDTPRKIYSSDGQVVRLPEFPKATCPF